MKIPKRKGAMEPSIPGLVSGIGPIEADLGCRAPNKEVLAPHGWGR